MYIYCGIYIKNIVVTSYQENNKKITDELNEYKTKSFQENLNIQRLNSENNEYIIFINIYNHYSII